MNELAYRVNFITQFFQAFLSLGLALGGLAVVFNQTDTLAGWRPAELTALVGIYMLVGGLINLVIQPSMQRFMEDIRMGTPEKDWLVAPGNDLSTSTISWSGRLGVKAPSRNLTHKLSASASQAAMPAIGNGPTVRSWVLPCCRTTTMCQ